MTMIKQAVISVVIPIYNTADYLEQCIESVQNQTYRNLEIILVDDGSTDGSGEICDRYAQGDPRIKVIHKANGGNNSARKAGIEASVGEYIGFVDSDDWIDTVMYERMAEEAEANSADMVVLRDLYYEYDCATTLRKCGAEPGVYSTRERKKKLLERLFFAGDYGCMGISGAIFDALYERELMEKYYKGIDNRIQYAEDKLLKYICLVNSRSVCVLEESYYHYRSRNNSLMHSEKKDILLNDYLLYKNFKEAFEKSDYAEILVKQLDIWIVSCLLMHINNQMGLKQGISIPSYMFPWELLGTDGKRVVLYGAGSVGQSYQRQLENAKNVELVAWVDADAEKYIEKGLNVESVGNILNYDYDRIIIAVKATDMADDIHDKLAGMGIDEDKILWEKPKSVLEYFLPYDRYCS